MSAVGWFWIGYAIAGLIAAKIAMAIEYHYEGWVQDRIAILVASLIAWPLLAIAAALWLLGWLLTPAGQRRRR